MSRIVFHYDNDDGVQVTVSVPAFDHINGTLGGFRKFLRMVGYHDETLDAIKYVEPKERQGLPQQLELPL